MRRLLAVWFFIGALSALSSAGPGYNVPKPGSPDRKAIMDVLRAPIQKAIGKKVIFRVDLIRQSGQWAFMRGAPLQTNGKAMDYKGTKFEEDVKLGMFEDWVCALFKKSNGKWKVVNWSLGATDVAFDGWDKKYGAPRSIFGYDAFPG